MPCPTFSRVVPKGADAAVFAVKLCGDTNTTQFLLRKPISGTRPPLMCNSA